jgi:hypothetical protein
MTSSIPEPTRPHELVCFKPFDFDTKEDGKIWMFFALDVFSHFMMSTGGTHRAKSCRNHDAGKSPHAK